MCLFLNCSFLLCTFQKVNKTNCEQMMIMACVVEKRLTPASRRAPNRKFAAIFCSFQIQLKIPLVVVRCWEKRSMDSHVPSMHTNTHTFSPASGTITKNNNNDIASECQKKTLCILQVFTIKIPYILLKMLFCVCARIGKQRFVAEKNAYTLEKCSRAEMYPLYYIVGEGTGTMLQIYA